ncbi:MAG TPA: hypothetical protein VIJ19_02695 [Opitutaceae bacterium]|jgi:hypothetical protein
MNLDIRYPIGLLFLSVGAVLAVYGLVSGPEIYAAHSLGLNVNLWWGIIQIVFGAIMVGLAKAGAKKG